MKTTLLFLISFVTFQCFSQTLSYYSLGIDISYMPLGGESKEWYTKTEHGYLSDDYTNGKKISKKHNPDAIEKEVNQLDSLFRLKEFKFLVKKSIIDSIKAHNSWGISDSDVNHFFSHGDTAIIRLKDIKIPSNEIRILDGAPYEFHLTIKRDGQDTVKYIFYGNLDDHEVEANKIKNWLPFFLVYREGKIFNKLALKYYFNDSHLEGILERFIEWTKT